MQHFSQYAGRGFCLLPAVFGNGRMALLQQYFAILFQAVQQLVAVMASQAAVVGVAADTAIAAVEAAFGSGGGDATFMAACAKARASEACYEVTRIAHQLHGAIGYTREHDLHRFTRRLWTWRDADGDEGTWQQKVGSMAVEVGGDGLWPLLAGA